MITSIRTLLIALSLLAGVIHAHAQGNAFMYQGRFTDNGNAYTGSAEFQATLWDAVSGGSQIAANSPTQVAVGVTNGLFVLPLDFGANFPGANRWLQLEVRTTIGPFTAITPRQQLTPAPYAITAGNLTGTLSAAQLSGTVASANLAGTYSSTLTLNNAANSFAGSGAGLTALNASQLTNGTVPDARLAANVARTNQVWMLGGNAGANPANGGYLGTTDNLPLEFRVNGQRALRIESATNISYGYSPNILGGFPGNVISNGFGGTVIGGGGSSEFPNRVGDDFAVVVGGLGNTASGFASTAMGASSTASGFYSTAMGYLSTASGLGSTAMGYECVASGAQSFAMGAGSTGSGIYSTAMGYNTTASGLGSTAMGFRAKANHQGAFVWADLQGVDFASTADNQFCIRAYGGVQLSGNTRMFFGSALDQRINLYGTTFGIGIQSGVQYSRVAVGGGFAWFAGGVHNDNTFNSGGGATLMTLTSGGLTVNGTFVSGSDRNAKENFAPVQPRAMLEKVLALPLSSWNYKADTATRHVGPMAQDFYAAFNVGPDDKHIATVDADGVALAAIQGLNQKVDAETAALRAENAALRKLNGSLEQRLEKLERLMNRENGGAR